MRQIARIAVSATFKDILAHVVPQLRTWGFKGSGQNHRLSTEHSVCIVNFQKSTGAERFYVNVGVQPLFVPSESSVLPNSKETREPECIFRSRVEPPTGMLGWPYTVDDVVLRLLSGGLEEKLKCYVTPLMLFPGPLSEVTPQAFSETTVHPLFGARHSRTFLHFSRIALAFNRPQVATEFAQIGMEICPEKATVLSSELAAALQNASH